jgi:hypothetical protein
MPPRKRAEANRLSAKLKIAWLPSMKFVSQYRYSKTWTKPKNRFNILIFIAKRIRQVDYGSDCLPMWQDPPPM